MISNHHSRLNIINYNKVGQSAESVDIIQVHLKLRVMLCKLNRCSLTWNEKSMRILRSKNKNNLNTLISGIWSCLIHCISNFQSLGWFWVIVCTQILWIYLDLIKKNQITVLNKNGIFNLLTSCDLVIFCWKKLQKHRESNIFNA